MADFNQYNLYAMAATLSANENEQLKKQELTRIANAFINFHKPETYEERQKFVNDTLQGRNYNQTIEFCDETIDFEFTEEFVRVTLHSPIEGRNNAYFQYSIK